MSFLIYGLHSRNKRGVKAMLEPLAHIRIEAILKEPQTLGQIRECEQAYIPQALLLDHTRRCVALFISEILFRTLTHPLQDEAMFAFLEQTIRELDTCPDPQDAHLRFLVRYADFLGFAIDPTDPANRQAIGEVPGSSRRTRLHALMDYYLRHIPDFTVPNSLAVLEDVFALD